MGNRCWPAFVVFCAVGLTLGACGSPAPPEPAREATPPAPTSAKAEDTTVKGPCALVTKTEAEALLRAPTERNKPEGPTRLKNSTQSSCFYRSDNGTIQLILFRYDSSDVARTEYERLRKRYRGSDAYDVTGVGESAFWFSEALIVRNADVHLHLTVKFEDDREIKSYNDKQAIDTLIEVQKRLALQALKRVPQAAPTS